MKVFLRQNCAWACLATGLATTLLPGVAIAQTADAAASTPASQDIVVTAQRREQSLQSVPQPVQALGGTQLLRSGITDIAATIQLVPSATIGSTISAGSNVFQIRGVAASETDGDATVGYYLDNFAFALPGRPFAPAADFYDLQRVEVLRGPSGTLYGLGSLGGTIKVLTNDPDLNAFHGSVRLSASGTDGGQPNGTADVMFNAPIIPGKLAVRAVASYNMIGGYADAIPSGEKNANDAHSFTGRVKVLAEPTDNLKLRFTYWRNQSNQNYSNRLTYFDPPALDQTFGIANSKYSIYTGDIEYDLGFATLQSTTGYIKNTVVTNNGGVIPGIGRFDSFWPLTSTNFNEDARLTSNGNGPFKYIVGVFYTNGKTVGGQSVSLPDYALPGITGLATFNDNTLRSKAYAIYGEGTYSFFDRKVDLTIGGRYYHEKRQFDENSSITLISLGSTTPTVGVDRAQHSTFNPRVNLAWHIGDGMVYAEVAKGFRSGAITSTSIMAGANLALGTNFSNSSSPDTLWNYEGGVKWGLFDNKVRISLAGYYFDWKHAAIEISPTLQTVVVPVGNVHGRGIDGEINWRTPLTGLTINLSGNHNKTTIEDTIAQVAVSLPWLAPGHQLPGTAKTTFAISGTYTRPINSKGLEFRASGRYTYRSRQQSVFDGRYAPWIGLGAARAGVGNDSFDLAVFSENIGNTRGPLSVPGGQYQIPFPRTIGLAFEYKF
ncbi:TonB-dependent receptor [Sphingomonas oryzagri]|uniref:TonB-dependent receptor plug domain-containing protein n=1 Tax=Sphingomonas oryzagri TaxID=3042314 RepID=A0ABT6MXX0_9SPHN|nr:TonB-dependent receptor plug domain-containing protein [Sphingomonas oryzagri]MDH7637339.1 TonB-dependent receptor plug domain-containing protein [Sphingomonas oryzagri]